MRVYSVGEATEQIKNLLESHFESLYVEGEVSRPTYHSSGHLYFSLKDRDAVIKCVMFRSYLAGVGFKIEEGQRIIAGGSLGLYKPRGEYQLYVKSIETGGRGELALAFERLKRELEKRGYFDRSRKKEIPKKISKIALVTSSNGAALSDMLKVVAKRWPLVEILLVETLVQGRESAPHIAEAVRVADSLNADVIVLSRGGGSPEDLWGFNEEVVARAVFEAVTPIVSAVGHEIDFLISDMVADLRAPTPSAAIEMILPDRNEYLLYLDQLAQMFENAVESVVRKKEGALESLYENIAGLSPIGRLRFFQKEISQSAEALERSFRLLLESKSSELPMVREALYRAVLGAIERKQKSVIHLTESLNRSAEAVKPRENTAQVVKEGRPAALQDLDVGDEIELQDGRCAILAKVLRKECDETKFGYNNVKPHV